MNDKEYGIGGQIYFQPFPSKLTLIQIPLAIRSTTFSMEEKTTPQLMIFWPTNPQNWLSMINAQRLLQNTQSNLLRAGDQGNHYIIKTNVQQ